MIIYIAFLWILYRVAREDLKTMTIPDRYYAMIMMLALMQMIVQGEIEGIERVSGALTVALPMYLCNVILPGAIGGGDVKLVFAAGFLLKTEAIVEAACLGFVGAGVYGALQLARGRMKRDDCFAFGPFLCGAMAVSVLGG